MNDLFKVEKSEYRNKMVFLQQMYYTAESDILHMLEYIHPDNDSNTYSLKFLSIISIVINTIEEILRLVTFNDNIPNDELEKFQETLNKNREEDDKINFSNKNSIERIGFKSLLEFQNVLADSKLFEEKISLIENPFSVKELNPFITRKYAPSWYEDYNLFKHNQFDHYKKATLGNAIESLAALYLIYNIALYELNRLGSDNQLLWHECSKPRVSLLVGQPLVLRSKLFGTWWYKNE